LVGFQSPLSDESVREAYFLGQRNDASTAAFFANYLKTLAPPETGPYVSEVEIYTPFDQLIELSRVNSVGYSAQQAGKDYRRMGDFLFVRVRIDFTSSYGALELYRSGRLANRPKRDSSTQSPNYSRDFRVGLSQKGEWIEPLSIKVTPTCWPAYGHVPFFPPIWTGFSPEPAFGYEYGYGTGFDYCFLGWQVWLQYDAADVPSDDSDIEVLTTDGQHVVVPFDLSRLR
jgi:hypothetical protein